MPSRSAQVIPEGLTREVLRALVETADLGQVGISVVAVDVDPPEYLFLNAGAAEMLGYTVEELVQIPIWELFPPDTRLAMRQRHQRRLDGSTGTSRFEVWVRRKDGHETPFEITTSRVEVGGRPANVTFMHDVSARTQALEALAASEARFRTLVESAPDGVVILRGTKLTYLNSAAAAMLGYSQPEDAVGHSITSLLSPADAARAQSRIARIVDTQRRFSEPAEYRSRRGDGREITVEISSMPIEFEGAPAVLAFARDITERKAMHEKMIQADRLAAVGTLAAGIAHEINNPLAYALLGLQYLERELPKLAREPARLTDLLARLAEVKSGAERVGNIVRNLKMFARANEVERGPVDLRSVVEAAVTIAENEIRHRATLVRDYGPAPPVDGNAARLEQVFLNLLVNAAHAVSDCEPHRSEIRIVMRTGCSDTVVVEIIDTGAGIPSDVLARVFDPFFTTKPIGVGTGLGLPICRNIVEGFGGQIGLESQPGVGTVARVTLPAFAGSAEARPATLRIEPLEGPPPRRGRILVVDDEPLVAGLLQRMLSAEHDVAIATSGQAALDALDQGAFDAIVCDVMMPGMTGMDLYAALRAKNAALSDRMVFMTGGAFVPRVAEFLSSVKNPKVDKPLDLSTLIGALGEITGRAR